MKKLVYFLSALVLLSACGGGNGTSGPAKSPQERLQEAASATDFSLQIPPNNFTIIKANISYEEQKERYAIGCKNPGEVFAVHEMDPQLRVGSIFKFQAGGQTLLEPIFGSVSEDRVMAVEALKVSFEKNYDFINLAGPFTSVEQVFSQRPHSKTELIYSIDDKGLRSSVERMTEANLTPAALDFFSNNQKTTSTNISCYLDYKSPNYKSTYEVDKISYQLAGRMHVAYRVRSLSQGADLICEQRTSSVGQPAPTQPDFSLNMGPGKQESFEIYSNEVVERGMYSCGGSSLYFSFKIYLETGKIVSSYVDKTISAPTR